MGSKLLRKIILIITLMLIATVSLAVNRQRIGTFDLLGWETMSLSGDFRTMTVSGGKPELKTTDGRFYAKANKMTVTRAKKVKGAPQPAGQLAIESAEMVGNVVFSAHPEPNRYIKGSGAKLSINGAEQVAVLDGGGKIIQVEAMDPEIYVEPTVLLGEVIRVNLKPNLSPDDWRIIVQSRSEKSRLSVTPKPRSESK